MRLPLEKGTEIASTYTYTMDSVVGTGANCIVYNAHFFDSKKNRKEIRIKECFPIGEGISRKEQNVCWADLQQKETAIARFEQSYQISNKIQNEVTMNKSSIYTLDFFECNNTMYMVIIPDHGISYDKDTSDNVADAVNTALALANVIGTYHRNGYLHLDIKPSNFIATDDSTGNGKNIVLFDTDTVVSFDDIRNGSIPAISYSKEWAAPEQMQQKMKKICPATDLFSIGAILFERVMGRSVSIEDMSVMAKWDYDERLKGGNVNPAVRRILSDIFHNTLSANVKRRYQSAEELAEKLKQVLELLTGSHPFITTVLPALTCVCIGRETEIDKLSKALKTAGKVFVKGPGGIGKSTLARKYAEVFYSEYDAVVYLRYDRSTTIASMLETIPIKAAFPIDDKYEVLQAVCDEKMLIIIDNLDIGADEDDLDLLLSLNCHIIVTTRTDFGEVYSDIPVIKLSGLSHKSLRELFDIESNQKLSDEDFSKILPLIQWGEECTLFWFMLARLVKSGGYSIKEISNMFNSGAFDYENMEKILVNKDGHRKKMTISDAMDELFRLAELTEWQTLTLHNIYFLQTIGVSKQKIREIAKVDASIPAHQYINATNDLIELGYVQEIGDETKSLFLSDILGETIVYSTHPVLKDADVVNALIEADFLIPRDLYKDNISDELKEDLEKYLYSCLIKIFMQADMEINANAEYMVDRLFYPACKVPCICDRFAEKSMEYIFKTLLGIATDEKHPVRLRIKAYNVLCGFYGDLTRIGLFGEEIDVNTIKAVESCQECFIRAIKLSENIKLTDSERDDLCYPFVDKFIGQSKRMWLLSAETLDAIIRLNPPIINQNVTPWKQFKIAALKNLDYQKLYLQEMDKYAESVSEDERRSIYYKTIGKILISRNVNWSTIDEEHFRLLSKFYVTCADKFFDIDKINVSDFAEDPLGVPNRILFNEIFIEYFHFMMSFDTWEEYQTALNNAQEKINAEELEEEMELADVCLMISSAESLSDIYSAIHLGVCYIPYLSKEDLLRQKESIDNLIIILDDVERRLFKMQEDSFSDDGIFLKTNKDVLLYVYALQTIIFVLDTDFDSSEDAYVNYLQLVNLGSIYDMDIETGGNGNIIAPCFWLIVESIYKFADIGHALMFLIAYTKMAEKEIISQSYIPETMLYELYKVICEWAEEVQSKVIDMGDRSVIESIEDYVEEEAENFLKSVLNEYNDKIHSLFPVEFNA